MELATLNATFLIRDDNRGDEESKFMGHTGVGKRSSHMQLELTKIYTTVDRVGVEKIPRNSITIIYLTQALNCVLQALANLYF